MNDYPSIPHKDFCTFVVTKCPIDDCKSCTGSYVNKIFGHRIVCKCGCHIEAKPDQDDQHYIYHISNNTGLKDIQCSTTLNPRASSLGEAIEQ